MHVQCTVHAHAMTVHHMHAPTCISTFSTMPHCTDTIHVHVQVYIARHLCLYTCDSVTSFLERETHVHVDSLVTRLVRGTCTCTFVTPLH